MGRSVEMAGGIQLAAGVGGAVVNWDSIPRLHTSPAGGKFLTLSNEQYPQCPAGPAGSNVRGIPEDPLESAIAFVGGNARTDGEEPFGLRQKAAFIQRAALVQWAEKSGLIASPSMWEGKAVIGGSEHDIWEMDGEIWKVTRPDRFGWTVLPGEAGVPHIAEATPLEYLKRWQNANRLLGDNAILRGVSETEEGVQVVISHPFIEGHYPEKIDIIGELHNRGFVLVPRFFIGSESDSSFYNDDKRIGIFDATCDNFILSQGVPIPVDVVIVEVGAMLRLQLL
jgi:hypothetical protein